MRDNCRVELIEVTLLHEPLISALISRTNSIGAPQLNSTSGREQACPAATLSACSHAAELQNVFGAAWRPCGDSKASNCSRIVICEASTGSTKPRCEMSSVVL